MKQPKKVDTNGIPHHTKKSIRIHLYKIIGSDALYVLLEDFK